MSHQICMGQHLKKNLTYENLISSATPLLASASLKKATAFSLRQWLQVLLPHDCLGGGHVFVAHGSFKSTTPWLPPLMTLRPPLLICPHPNHSIAHSFSHIPKSRQTSPTKVSLSCRNQTSPSLLTTNSTTASTLSKMASELSGNGGMTSLTQVTSSIILLA